MVETSREHLQTLKAELDTIAAGLKGAIDTSLEAVSSDPSAKSLVSHHWEDMLSSFYSHMRQRKTETGHNLLSWVSFQNITRR